MPQKHSILGRPQFALRTLVIGGLLLGALTGSYGPQFARAVRVWLQPPPVQVQQPTILSTDTGDSWDPAETGYYESAETPLR